MGSKMTLLEAIRVLDALDTSHTIYAMEPWHADSSVIVGQEADDGTMPSEAAALGLKYFLEISITLEVIEGWRDNIEYTPTLEQICNMVIYYATYDAWPELD